MVFGKERQTRKKCFINKCVWEFSYSAYLVKSKYRVKIFYNKLIGGIMSNNLSQVLGQFMNVKGVTAVALVGRDGFVIESTANNDVDMDALGAMVATAVGTAESLGQEFGLGAMDQYLSEFASGKVIMATAVDDILAVFTDDSAIIGGVRFAVKKHLPEVISTFQ